MDPLDRVGEVLEMLACISTIGSFLLGLWNILTGHIRKHKRKRKVQETDENSESAAK